MEVVTGWLLKRSKVVKWKRCWCCLTPTENRFSYYESPDDFEPLGVILDLPNYLFKTYAMSDSSSSSGSNGGGNESVIVLELERRPVPDRFALPSMVQNSNNFPVPTSYQFHCESQQLASQFVDGFRQCCQLDSATVPSALSTATDAASTPPPPPLPPSPPTFHASIADLTLTGNTTEDVSGSSNKSTSSTGGPPLSDTTTSSSTTSTSSTAAAAAVASEEPVNTVPSPNSASHHSYRTSFGSNSEFEHERHQYLLSLVNATRTLSSQVTNLANASEQRQAEMNLIAETVEQSQMTMLALADESRLAQADVVQHQRELEEQNAVLEKETQTLRSRIEREVEEKQSWKLQFDQLRSKHDSMTQMVSTVRDAYKHKQVGLESQLVSEREKELCMCFALSMTALNQLRNRPAPSGQRREEEEEEALRQENRRLDGGLHKATSIITQLLDRNKNLMLQQNEYESKLAVRQNDIETLLRHNAEHRRAEQMLTDELDYLRAYSNELQERLSEAEETQLHTQNTAIHVNRLLEETRRVLAAAMTQNDQHKGRVDELQHIISELTEEREILDVEKDMHAMQLETERVKARRFENEVNILTAQRAQMEKELEQLKRNLNEAQRDAALARSEVRKYDLQHRIQSSLEQQTQLRNGLLFPQQQREHRSLSRQASGSSLPFSRSLSLLYDSNPSTSTSAAAAAAVHTSNRPISVAERIANIQERLSSLNPVAVEDMVEEETDTNNIMDVRNRHVERKQQEEEEEEYEADDRPAMREASSFGSIRGRIGVRIGEMCLSPR